MDTMIPILLPTSDDRGGGEPPPTWFVILIGIIFLFFICLFIDMKVNRFFSKLLFIKRAKDWPVPAGYIMRYNPDKKTYIIQQNYQYSHEYLEVNVGGRVDLFIALEFATTFSDSSKAKGALKKYLGSINYQ